MPHRGTEAQRKEMLLGPQCLSPVSHVPPRRTVLLSHHASLDP